MTVKTIVAVLFGLFLLMTAIVLFMNNIDYVIRTLDHPTPQSKKATRNLVVATVLLIASCAFPFLVVIYF